MSDRQRMSIRRMTRSDIDFAMELKNAERWNQLPEDWERYLDWEPNGCFIALWDGERAGTATTIQYGDRFGWIGMVVVRRDLRRCGIATALLERSIEYLEALGVCAVKLDATPAGRPLYEGLGFEAEYAVERHECDIGQPREREAITPMSHDDMCAVCQLDLEAFGGDRRRVLESLSREEGVDSMLVRDGSEIAGYAFVRPGMNARQIGPWLAKRPEAAAHLLQEALRRHQRPILVDIPLANAAVAGMVKEHRFGKQRDFKRMYRGKNSYPGATDMVYGLAGPEIG